MQIYEYTKQTNCVTQKWNNSEYALGIVIVNINLHTIESHPYVHDIGEVPLGFLLSTSSLKFNEESFPFKETITMNIRALHQSSCHVVFIIYSNKYCELLTIDMT